jgi:UDP-N-acetylmuramate dehydrogenase
MTLQAEFADITRRDEPLAPYTWLKIGGPAQFFIEPRNQQELQNVVRYCAEHHLQVRVLGGGSNLLVKDEGISGVVIHLTHSEFDHVSIEGNKVTAGAGALLSHVVSRSIAAGLAGLENLAGIPGTLGGALKGNAGGKHGDIGPLVTAVEVMEHSGEIRIREKDELAFTYRQSNLDELVILSATMELHAEDPQEITRRLRKLWIMKKALQPLTYQSAGCIFKNPRGMSAGALIDQSGLKGTRIGDVEVSDRHANFFVTYENATSADLLRLIDLVKTRVQQMHGIDLELEIQIWG